MSPVGLDVRQFNYSFYEYPIADGTSHVITPRDAFASPTISEWYVTRIQFWTGANPGVLRLVNPSGNPGLGAVGLINVAANGCIELLPGGAYRGSITVSGEGAKVVIEYWYAPQLNAGWPIPMPDPP